MVPIFVYLTIEEFNTKMLCSQDTLKSDETGDSYSSVLIDKMPLAIIFKNGAPFCHPQPLKESFISSLIWLFKP